MGTEPRTYWLTRIFYIRAITFIYFVAFLVAYHQNKQLIGDQGLSPLRLHMEQMRTYANSWYDKIWAAPTLLWYAEPWTNVNPWLDNIALAGATLSFLMMMSGRSNVLMMLNLWILYHSLVNVGQRFYSFGWESQLLETGLLAIWAMPLTNLSYLPEKFHYPWVMIWGLRWLVIRIMLGAGLIKIRGDQCWRDLTCMNYHYETQPVPNPLSYYLHKSPEVVHMGETFGNHIVELIVPFFGFFNRKWQITCGIIQIVFQVILIISGNLSFLNWLTIVPSIAFFDDQSLSFLFTKTTLTKVNNMKKRMQKKPEQFEPGIVCKGVNWLAALLIGYLSLPVVLNLLSSQQLMNTSYDPFRIVNTYGAFGSVTKTRGEIIIQGTHDALPDSIEATWKDYEFKCKPGRLDKTPCFISPYHYRLDWLMWFAAFQNYQQNPWLVHLVGKLLLNDSEALSLMAYNPFKDDKPPKYIRALLYQYEYTDSISSNSTHWYKRTYRNTYLPNVDIPALKPLFKKLKWKTLDKY